MTYKPAKKNETKQNKVGSNQYDEKGFNRLEAINQQRKHDQQEVKGKKTIH